MSQSVLTLSSSLVPHNLISDHQHQSSKKKNDNHHHDEDENNKSNKFNKEQEKGKIQKDDDTVHENSNSDDDDDDNGLTSTFTPSSIQQSKVMDEFVLKKIQQLIYLIVKELFDLNRTNLVRRNFVSFLRKSVKVLLTNSISKSITNLSLKYDNDDTTSKFLNWLINTIWNLPGHIMGPRLPIPTQQERNQRQILIRNEFVMGGIPLSITSLLGRINCDEATLKLYEFLQCSVLIRSLLYCALDLFWKQLFPDDEILSELYGGKNLEWEEHHKEN
jgi:hypothetical protein